MRPFLLFLAATAVLGPVLLFGWPEPLIGSVMLLSLVGYLTVCDIRDLRLPDHATLPLALLGIIVTWANWPSLLPTHLAAALVSATILWGISAVWLKLRQVDALGFGDVKFSAAAALWVGPAISVVVMLSAASALLVATVAIWMGAAQARDPIPFGPFLCAGLWAVWCWFAA